MGGEVRSRTRDAIVAFRAKVQGSSTTRRVLDFILYLLIAFLVAAGAYWSAFLKVSEDLLIKWVGMSVFTAALFGWVIKLSRRRWRKRVFWWTIAALLFIHTVAFWVILRNVEKWRMAWFLVICTIEVIPVTAILDWMMRRNDRRDKTADATRAD
jgi:hypothetical protein